MTTTTTPRTPRPAGIAGGAASYPKQTITLNVAVVLIRRVAQQRAHKPAAKHQKKDRQ